MNTFMIQLGIMSLQASVAVLAVLVLRQAFAALDISKKYVMLLWMIPFLLLVCPFKISSPIGLWSSAPSDYAVQDVENVLERLQSFLSWTEIRNEEVLIEDGQNGMSEDIGVANGMQGNEDANQITGQSGSLKENGIARADGQGYASGEAWRDGTVIYENSAVTVVPESLKEVLDAATVVWGIGMVGFLSYAVISYLRLKKKVRCCIQKLDNIYLVDDIAVPIVAGALNPKIYLPSGMGEAYVSYVVAHETMHIKRHDPLVKLAAYVIACVHWFNPLVWLAYHFLEKDMEMACDEETIQQIGMEKKRDYATALLQLSTGSRSFFAVPLAFGEGDTKGRIKNVMNYKKTVKSAAILAVAAGVLVFAVFMTKGGYQMGDSEAVESTDNSDAVSENNMVSGTDALDEALIAEQQALLDEMQEMEARREETEKQKRISEMNQQKELTFAMVREAAEKQILHELDFQKFANGENKKEETDYSLNYYINFYFTDYEYSAEGEEYRLGVSLWLEDDSLADIYITRTSDWEMAWLYDAEDGIYRSVLEEFLASKEDVNDWLSVELPEGYTLGEYNANYGYMGGALISPQAYELYGEDVFAPADWYYAGCVSRMPDATERYQFVDGKLQEHHGVPWNHTSAEFVEVLDLDWQAILMEVNHDLYTAAGTAWLEEDGIDTTQIDTTSDYWYFFFVKEGEDTSYYLSLSKKCFTKEEAIAIAETVDIKE